MIVSALTGKADATAADRDLKRVAGPLLDALVKSGMPVAIADADHRNAPLFYANAAFLELMDATATEVAAGDYTLATLTGKDAGPLELLAPGSGTRSLQAFMRRKDGSDFWVNLTLTPIADKEGACSFILITAVDAVTSRDARELDKSIEAKRRELERLSEQAKVGWRVAGASGAWEWDIATGVFCADARFAALTGIQPEDAARGVPGTLFFKSIHPDDRLRIQIAVAAALQGAEVFARRYRIVSPDSSVYWVSATGRSYLDAAETPVRFAGVLTDITEQKRVEDQLQLAQSAGGIGTFLYESGFGTAEVSHEFCRLLGFHKADSLPVKTINSVVHSDGPPIIGKRASEQGELPYTEIRVRRADDGVERWIALRGQVRPEGGGHRFMGAIYDITESKRVQNSLRDLNQTLEDRVRARTRERDRLWSLSRDLICVCEADGTMKAANPAWLHLLGFAPDDLVKSRFQDLVHRDDRDELRRKLSIVSSGRAVQDFDLRLTTSGGHWNSINWSIMAEGGDIYCVGRDVTARLQLQAELHQSQKMEAVGQLTGGIAHDFNNMLTGVIGCLDILQRRIETGRLNDLDRFMHAATSSAQRAAALTHRLLAFSRRQSLESRSVDLNALTRSMEELLHRTLGEQVRLTVDLEEHLPAALIDANQLESAILNLAINARDAMESGGELTIRTSRVHLHDPAPAKPSEIRPGEYVCITVSDTGSGMAEEVLTKVFDPFFTTKPIGQGTGLGLSMIYGFVQQSRGHVSIDSVVGRGTSVTLYLPESKDEAELVLELHPGVAPTGDGEQVLIVEDDPSVRLLVLDVLRELNYVGIEAASGLEALEILGTAANIRLLITDIGLPGLSGREVAEIARRRRPDLPVLFMTAYSPDALNRRRFLEPGMDMISKPFSLLELASKVKTFLAQDRDTPPLA
ncbi:MAG: hybrid sensor histidine kinase/response regulator [Hyphomicrobiales bacterium]|nr:hybrid sensor histidine kinase/response regulator [Hyphomicrobiales bacterium]